MSGIFPKLFGERKGQDVVNTRSDLDLEEDCAPVQEQQCNAPSGQHITRYHTNVGDHPHYSSRNPIVVSGRVPASSISLFKTRNQDITPQNRSQDIVPRPRNLYEEYRSESERLKTFNDWPTNSVVDKESLARNGFVYLHVGDRVQCMFCRGTLSDWEAGDIVENEHKTHCPECPHAFGYECGNIPISTATLERRTVFAPASALRNVPASPQAQRHVSSILPRTANTPQYNTTVNVPVQFQNSSVNIRPNQSNSVNVTSDLTISGDTNLSELHSRLQAGSSMQSANVHQNTSDAIGRTTTSIPTPLPGGLVSPAPPQGPVVSSGPRYKEWEQEDRRIKSFVGWPAQMTQTPIALAEAGLLYMGSGDRCKCFWCGGELYDWEPEDEPFEEHAKWFPHCGYLRAKKGTEFIQYVRDKQNGLVQDTFVLGLFKRPHVKAVLADGYTEEQVEEVFNRFGENKLVDAPTIIKAIKKTQEEREAARVRAMAVPIVVKSEDGKTALQMSSKAVDNLKAVSSGSRPGSASSVGSAGDKDLETVLQENEKLKDQKMCKICMDNDVCMMFLPCKHLATCEGCSHIVKECPVCRRSIEERIKVFWS